MAANQTAPVSTLGRGDGPELIIVVGELEAEQSRYAGVSGQSNGYKRGALRACCGGGGPYNYNMSASCGLPGATTCEDPDAHVSWDGIHLTEAPYRFIANTWIRGPYAHPPLASVVRDDMVY
uniref:Uncharacterized protein n=1 Tax=Oryza rufipogon TaxID=4529 RepID=A0A0E0PIX2_ORYRU